MLLDNLQSLKKKDYLQRMDMLEKARQDERQRLVAELGQEKADLIPDSDLLKEMTELA